AGWAARIPCRQVHSQPARVGQSDSERHEDRCRDHIHGRLEIHPDRPAEKRAAGDQTTTAGRACRGRSTMSMIQLDLQQGSEEWLDSRLKQLNASEAPVMMGCHPNMRRDELLE